MKSTISGSAGSKVRVFKRKVQHRPPGPAIFFSNTYNRANDEKCEHLANRKGLAICNWLTPIDRSIAEVPNKTYNSASKAMRGKTETGRRRQHHGSHSG